jgi:hypothetical protein
MKSSRIFYLSTLTFQDQLIIQQTCVEAAKDITCNERKKRKTIKLVDLFIYLFIVIPSKYHKKIKAKIMWGI